MQAYRGEDSCFYSIARLACSCRGRAIKIQTCSPGFGEETTQTWRSARVAPDADPILRRACGFTRIR